MITDPDAHIAECHDVISHYKSITDPDQHPALRARSQALLRCGEDSCVPTLCEALNRQDQQLDALRVMARDWLDSSNESAVTAARLIDNIIGGIVDKED